MTSPAPGWYPDPGATAPYRWWNGQAWTTATSDGAPPAAAQPVSAVPVAPAAPAAYAPGQAYPAHAYPQAPVTAAPAAAPGVPQQPQYGAVSPYGQHGRPQNNTLWDKNQWAFFTFISLAVSIMLVIATGFAFIVFTPMVLSGASRNRGEPLAPLALGAAALALVIGVVSFMNHFG